MFGSDAEALKRVLADAADKRDKEHAAKPAPVEGGGFARLPLNLCGNETERRRIVDLLNGRKGDYPCGLLICDAVAPGAPLIYANGYLEDMTGHAHHEILGRSYSFLQRRGRYATARHDLVDRATSDALAAAFNKGIEWKGEIVSFKKDGSPMRTRANWVPLHGDRSLPTRVTHWAGYLKFYPMRNVRSAAVDSPSSAHPSAQEGSAVSKVVLAQPRFNPGSVWARVASFLSLGRMGPRRPDVGLLDLSAPLHAKILEQLDLHSALAVSATCRELHGVVTNAHGLWHELCIARVGAAATRDVAPYAARLGWTRVVRELHTLEAVGWDSIKVAGMVLPARINFSMCAVGAKLLLFGGEAERSVALADTHMVDLSQPLPFWQKLTLPPDAAQPAGRWGHSLRAVADGRLILFGGCGANGALNDCHVLHQAERAPRWEPLHLTTAPSTRSWHGATTLSNNRLMIFGGCDAVGRMLNDTWILHLHPTTPFWQQLDTPWAPSPRLGMSLCASPSKADPGNERVVMFGGLAAMGPALRLRTDDTLTLSPNDPTPSWRFVCGAKPPGKRGRRQPPPPSPAPRMEQVLGVVAGDCAIMFGGSLGDSSSKAHSVVSEPWVCRLNDATPMWRALPIQDAGPPSLHGLAHTWGYSATMLDSTHFAWLGARHGALVFDEVFVLSLLSPPPKTLPAVWPALEPPPMPLCHSTHAAWPARAKGKGKRLHSLEQQRCQQLEHKRQQAERSSPLGARSGLAGSGGDHSGGRHGSGYGSGCSESSVQCKRPKHDRHNSHSNSCGKMPTCQQSPSPSPSRRQHSNCSTLGSSGDDIGGSPGETPTTSAEHVPSEQDEEGSTYTSVDDDAMREDAPRVVPAPVEQRRRGEDARPTTGEIQPAAAMEGDGFLSDQSRKESQDSFLSSQDV